MMLDRMEGNAELKTSVQQMLATRRLTHSVLLVGEAGLGTGFAARCIAADYLYPAGGAAAESRRNPLNAVHMKKTLLFSNRFLLTAALFFCAASVVSCQKEPTADPAPARAAIRQTAKPADMVQTKSATDVA